MTADFPWTIAGIPCRVRIDSYLPGTPDGRFEPGDPEECEFVVLNRRGQRVEWLEQKMDDADREAIIERARKEYAEGLVP